MTNHMFKFGTVWGSQEVIGEAGTSRNKSGRKLHMFRVRCTVCGHESIKQTQSLNKLRKQGTRCCIKCPKEIRNAHRKPMQGKFSCSYNYKLDVTDAIARLAFGRKK